MKSCSDWQLYVIIDAQTSVSGDLVSITEAAIRGGADVIQLRDKESPVQMFAETAFAVHKVTQKYSIPLIINDYPEVARSVGAEGVHVGQDDLSVASVRKIYPGCCVGKSTHSIQQAYEAQAEAPDYIGVGPVYATPTKPTYESVGLELVSEVSKNITIPFVCIGGIDQNNILQVLHQGARCVAVVRAVCGAADPKAAASQLKQIILKTTRANVEG